MSDAAHIAALVASVEGFIITHANRYHERCPSIDASDFAQEGRLAAYRSAQRYNVIEGVPFMAASHAHIRGSMWRYMTQHCEQVRIPERKVGQMFLSFIRLDAPISEDSTATVADILLDAALPPSELYVTDRSDCVAAAMAHLSERQRTFLRLRFWDELTYEEIGDRMGITHQGARAGVRFALEILSRHIIP